MNRAVSILAGDAINALGADADSIWEAMLADRCGIGPLRRFSPTRYGTSIAGELADHTVQTLRGEHANLPLEVCACLTVARRVIKSADVDVAHPRTGLVLATAKGHMGDLAVAVASDGGEISGCGQHHLLAEKIRSGLGHSGPWIITSTACSAGLAGIIQAVRWLRRDMVDVAVVVSVEMLSHYVLAGFSSVGALSSQPCRPYDVDRDGLTVGEGAAALVLARQDAQNASATQITGWATSNDAEHIVSPSATGSGLALAFRRALDRAALAPSQIGFINGHGTATLKNDAMEAAAVARVFGEGSPLVGSFKGYFGHTLGAAGAVETVLCMKALKHGIVPRSMGTTRVGVEPCINVPKAHTAVSHLDHLVTVKAGFGGVNAALILSRGQE